VGRGLGAASDGVPEEAERHEQKSRAGGTAFRTVPSHFNHCISPCCGCGNIYAAAYCSPQIQGIGKVEPQSNALRETSWRKHVKILTVIPIAASLTLDMQRFTNGFIIYILSFE
jgi:hypothetical protein